MQKNRAKEILDLPDNYDMTLLKKKYHIKALQYHPDKNQDENAKERFQEVNEAYQLLSTYDNETHNINQTHYNTLLDYVISHIINKSESIMEDIDVNTLKNIRRYIMFYKPPKFDAIISLMDVIISRKEIEPEIILQPTIDDLMEQKIYKYMRGDEEFMVPLWHCDMIFTELSGKEFAIKCVPKLSKEFEIDIDNNLHYYVKRNIQKLLDMDMFTISIGKEIINLDMKKIYIQKHQIYTIKNKGIPIIQSLEKTIELGDIVIHIELF